MTRIAGPSRAQLDQAADQYADLLDRQLQRAVEFTLLTLDDRMDPDDLGVITQHWQALVDDLLAPTLALALHAGSAEVRQQLRRRLGLTAAVWNGVPATSAQLADAYLAVARNRLVGVGDQVWEHARAQLLEGQRAGESITQLKDRVAAATGLASPRAGVIARTEILDALNYGAHAEMAATGLDGTKEWLATPDSRTREDHVHADGQKVGVREKFTVGGWPADRPHDPALPADQSIQCRCSLTFEVDLADVSVEPADPAREHAQVEVDSQVLGAVWVADAIRRGVTADDLAALLALTPFLPDQEEGPEAETAAAETEPLHLPGKHNQKDHGHRRNRGGAGRGSAPAESPPSSGGAGGGGSAVGGRAYDDPAAAKKFLDDHYGQWKKKDLNDAEYAGLSFYQSPGFALMNGQLRGLKRGDIKADMSFGDADLKRARKASTDLAKGIGKAPPLPHAVQVHRGFDAAQFGDLSPGMTVTDKGFVSTSLTSSGVASVGRASKPGVMRIELPAGTKAGAGSARELILSPGSSFEVLGVSQQGGETVVDARLIGGGG